MTCLIVTFVVITTPTFPHSLLITGLVKRATRLVPLVEQELHTHPVGVDPQFLVGFVLRFFVYCLLDNALSLVLVGIALSVLLRFMASDCPFDIFKHFFHTFMLHVYVAIRHVRRICTFS